MKSMPTFSVIIPTSDRPSRLARCLRGFANLNYPNGAWEIVVVNDGGMESFSSITPAIERSLPLRLESAEHGGPASARNRGAGLGAMRYLAFTDDDCIPSPGWLKALADAFTADPGLGIGGRTIPSIRTNRFSIASQMLVDYLYQYYNPADGNSARFLASNNLAVPADLFSRVGGFDTGFRHAAGEDREFCDRWLHMGHALRHVPGAVMYHAHDMGPWGFLEQHFRYGCGAHRFHRIRSARCGEGVRLEPLRFYRGLLAYPLSAQETSGDISIVGLLLAAQASNALGFFYAEGMDVLRSTWRRRKE